MPAENGYVPTPAPVADLAAQFVFGVTRPSECDAGGRLLLPGVGTGNLYAAVRRYCTKGEHWQVPEWAHPVPDCVGVERQADLIDTARETRHTKDLTIHQADFLLDPPAGAFDWALANPPYTHYRNLDEDRRGVYADRFTTATGQYHLYAPFIERMHQLVKRGGTITVIVPIRALYAGVTEPLRRLIQRHRLGRVCLLPDATFDRQVQPILICYEKIRDDSDGWWLENILPYGPRPLLERLGVADVDAATDQYMRRLKTEGRRVQSVAPTDPVGDSAAADEPPADETTLDEGWS